MITVLKTRKEILEKTHLLPKNKIGIVPTMGNLHDGHLSLIKKSSEENQYTVVTIFVNPKQFGPNEDFDKYPRTLEKDIELITGNISLKADQEIIIFAPKSVEEMYPNNFDTIIKVGKVTSILCGANRPGHFDGVSTVVYQLFLVSNAHIGYFGEKDFQQVKVIEKMVQDLGLNITIKPMPISRDEDGLARSSRNQYLSKEQRQIALILPKTIETIQNILIKKSWLSSYIEINDLIEEVTLNKNNDTSWDYLEILDASNLEEISHHTQKVVILGAMRVGQTRLIDNRTVDIAYDG